MAKRSVQKDLYKVLRVSRTATMLEIKSSYRKLALALHPDRHDGCKDKAAAFKEASEAYDTLSNNDRRKEYDLATGWGTPDGWYNKNRRYAPPKDYRKVYTPHAPPDGKWHDAQKHYDFHYGDGLYHESVKKAYERAKMNGQLDYTSPLGKGFAFETREDRKKRRSYHNNPYSKDVQGPPSMHFKYEEGNLNTEREEADVILKRKEGVVGKLHERRIERMEKNSKGRSQQATTGGFAGQKKYPQYNQQSNGSCVIM
ncbi:MAG: hypothetical protein SGBAC_005049 [Bacillariaceae sp.]